MSYTAAELSCGPLVFTDAYLHCARLPAPLLPLAARKNEIYQVAVEHNLIILEDDPYYFLDFEGSSSPDGPARCPSLLSIDERAGGARVLRFDSFSKLLSAGIRVGFATGPSKLIESIELHTQASMLHASGVSQAVVSKIFDHLGGVDGFLIHVDDVTR